MDIKVIAIGNILMGDDSIGIRVLENIESDLKAYGIEAFIGETDFQYCISVIDDDNFIFIIDAAMLEKEIGTVTLIPLEEYRYYKKGYAQHSNSLLESIYTYYKDVKGYVIGIEIENITYDLNISNSLELLLEEISLSVLNRILEIAPIAENIRLT
jgi:hydrogenase maturation protease